MFTKKVVADSAVSRVSLLPADQAGGDHCVALTGKSDAVRTALIGFLRHTARQCVSVDSASPMPCLGVKRVIKLRRDGHKNKRGDTTTERAG